MPTIKSLFTRALEQLSSHQQSTQYTSPISVDDLTGEYLRIELPESLSSDAESAITALLTETHQNGVIVELTASEGLPSLFPPGASLFNTNGSTSRLQDLLSVVDRFTHVVRREESNVVVLNAARIAENIRIAEHDPGKSGMIAQQNLEALASALATLPDDCYQFINSDAVPTSARDNHLITFQETILYR